MSALLRSRVCSTSKAPVNGAGNSKGSLMSNSVQAKESLSASWQVCLAVLAVGFMTMVPEVAAAATSIEVVLCKLKNLFTGPMGKALATIALVIIGIGALLGKVSWGMALIVSIGIAIVFGAASLVDAIQPTGTSVAECSTTLS